MSGHGQPVARWLEVSARVDRASAGALESLLNGQGALAVTVTDHDDRSAWEPPADAGISAVISADWGEVRITGLFPGRADRELLRSVLSLVPGLDPASVRFVAVEDRDWERSWMDRFRPMRFGERLWIVPTGQSCPVEDALQLRLDPGLAFGTGTHPSTRLCLEWLDGRHLDGMDVIDFGCGSGVLGIAAALKGARRVRCIDNDPQAVSATLENARRNAVADRVEAAEGAVPPPDGADLVLANILAGTLTELAERIAASVRPGGWLVLSGLLASQSPAVRDAYGAVFPDLRETVQEEWVMLSGRKSSGS